MVNRPPGYPHIRRSNIPVNLKILTWFNQDSNLSQVFYLRISPSPCSFFGQFPVSCVTMSDTAHLRRCICYWVAACCAFLTMREPQPSISQISVNKMIGHSTFEKVIVVILILGSGPKGDCDHCHHHIGHACKRDFCISWGSWIFFQKPDSYRCARNRRCAGTKTWGTPPLQTNQIYQNGP